MSDFKSKIPNFHEITDMAGKLIKDVKHSVDEIVDDYKKKHGESHPVKKATKASEKTKSSASVKSAKSTKPSAKITKKKHN